MISAFYQSTKVTLKQCKCGDADKQFLNVHILGGTIITFIYIYFEFLLKELDSFCLTK